MGSKLRHSSRQRKAGTFASAKATATAPRTDFDALLSRFSDALSVVATATRALSTAPEHMDANPDHDISEDILTLEHGLTALRLVYNALDVSIREIRS